MPTPADERLLELLEKWLKSLELHVKYAGLDSDSYWHVQPWPEHQRPSRWIIDLASQKAAALKAQTLERIASGWHELGDKRAVLLVQLPPSLPRDDIRLAYFLGSANEISVGEAGRLEPEQD